MVMPVPSQPGFRVPRRMVQMRRGNRTSAPAEHFTQKIDGLPISGAQIMTTLDGSGNGQGTVGPTGMGTIWTPAACAISTSVQPFDSVLFNLYVGPLNFPTTLAGTILGGTGVLSLALPPMVPGVYLIGVWSGGTPGSVVSFNITGVYSTLGR